MPPAQALAAPTLTPSPGWLRSRTFDGLLILGTLNVALLSGLLVVGMPLPRLFPLVLFLDLWLLGYHHVISTFTRLTFDTGSLRQHWFLIFVLPFLVLGGVVLMADRLGPWAIVTTYLYWQWFHYTRQSYGLERMYWRKSGGKPGKADPLTWGVIYLLPLWGILQRSWEAQPRMLGMELRYLPVPSWLLGLTSGVAVAVLVVWGIRRLVELRRGELRKAHTLYLISHIVVFGTGYLLIDDITYGWLVVNVWHNAQYILVVWLFNTTRFKQGVDPAHRFLSWLSQPRTIAIVAYFGVCLALTTVSYSAVEVAADSFGATWIPLALVIYMSINFHHYLVDSVIWKLRKPRVRANLGLAGLDAAPDSGGNSVGRGP